MVALVLVVIAVGIVVEAVEVATNRRITEKKNPYEWSYLWILFCILFGLKPRRH
ncbi:hypothetical protein [Psychrobacillus sp. FJAT-51614]|uniref:hypothetical protein n=1 Tax=Psychrobacillus mangrovi TaxID=3117745 RepID=UPI003013CA33